MSDTILKFAAPWCEPCKALSKILEDIDLGEIKLQEVDIEQEKELVAKYRVRSVPTMVFLKDDKPVKVLIGAKSKTEVQSWINQ
jgi:thioredoxin-like negative regulator of GroEL